jgi:hypothetical protein
LSYIPESCGLNGIPIHHLDAGSENILNNKFLKPTADPIHSWHDRPNIEPGHRYSRAYLQNYAGFSVYVWDSEQLFQRYFQNRSFFNLLKQQGIHRLLISFTMNQIKNSDTP